MVKGLFIQKSCRWRWSGSMSKPTTWIRMAQLDWQTLRSFQLCFIFLHLLTRKQVLFLYTHGDQRQREIYLRSSRKSTAEQGTKPGISEFQTRMLTMGQLISSLWEFLLPNCIRGEKVLLVYISLKQTFIRTGFNTSQIHYQDYHEMFNKSLNPNDRIGWWCKWKWDHKIQEKGK